MANTNEYSALLKKYQDKINEFDSLINTQAKNMMYYYQQTTSAPGLPVPINTPSPAPTTPTPTNYNWQVLHDSNITEEDIQKIVSVITETISSMIMPLLKLQLTMMKDILNLLQPDTTQ